MFNQQIYENTFRTTNNQSHLSVLGRIQAGFASPGEEELSDTISLEEYLLGDKASSYLLKVQGDSMIDAGILEGDFVIFERRYDYVVGDIVVALTEDGYTLKYLQKKNGHFYLEAGNESYPAFYPREGQIIGVVTGSFRTYGKK